MSAEVVNRKPTTILPARTAETSQTPTDQWAQTTTTTESTEQEIYSRAKSLFGRQRISRRITDEINSDPDEVQRLLEAEQEVADGKTRRYRKRATKSD